MRKHFVESGASAAASSFTHSVKSQCQVAQTEKGRWKWFDAVVVVIVETVAIVGDDVVGIDVDVVVVIVIETVAMVSDVVVIWKNDDVVIYVETAATVVDVWKYIVQLQWFYLSPPLLTVQLVSLKLTGWAESQLKFIKC